MHEQVIQQLADTPATPDRLGKAEMDLSNGSANQRSKIAEYKAPKPLVLRQDRPISLVLIAHETFTTDGTASNTETFNLSQNLVETVNTEDFVLYEGGAQVQPDAVSYSGDSFDYTDDNTNSTLHAYYVCRDPLQVEIEKKAPQSMGKVSETLFDDVTSLVHTKDQNEDPITFDLGESALQPVVPTNWKLNIYADGPYAPTWNESTDGTEAVNAVLSLPYKQGQGEVENLGKAVAHDIVERA